MISVIIPMYNSQDTIIMCIESVLNQTQIELIKEIIVIDDGSTDNSYIAVWNKYRNNKLIRIIKKNNGGVSAARNTGIIAARGEWIAFLDSDDKWVCNKIEKQWEKISKYSEICFIGSNRNEENVKWGKKMEENLYCLDLFHVLIKVWPHTSSVLVKRALLNKVGMFDEKKRYGEDVALWSRIAINNKIYYISESLEIAGDYKFQFGQSGLSANISAMHQGEIENIKELYVSKDISFVLYVFLKMYNSIKYLRRIILVKLRG